MSPPYASANITLSCPLYASDFDPQNNGFLLVGGGGGEGRSGVGNKINLLNTSKKYEISEVLEIDLSRNEDSVTSLAFAQTTESWASAFAGINSSTAEQEAGNNQHLRSFLLEYPPRRKAGATEDADSSQEKRPYAGNTKALGKLSYFSPDQGAKPETFQRVLRLSKQREDNGPRIGAVATGLAPIGEIVLFAGNTNNPSLKDIRGRIKLGKKEEAADVAVLAAPKGTESQNDSEFLVAYCTDYDIYTTKVSYAQGRDTELPPRCIHGIPHPDVFASTKSRPKFRSLRLLTPTLFLILQNLPLGSGSELLLMTTQGETLLRKRLHKKIKSATALTVAALPYPAYPSKNETKIQHAIAIAGADTSITILTLDHSPSAPYKALKFLPHLFFPAAHPTSITSLTFSTHHPASRKWSEMPLQYLKLASTSIANTVVVYTLPLTPYPPRRKNEDPIPHYVLNVPRKGRYKATETMFSIFVVVLAFAIGSFFLQSFAEVRGWGVPERLGASAWVEDSWLSNTLLGKIMMGDFGAGPVGGQQSPVQAEPSIRAARELGQDGQSDTQFGRMGQRGESSPRLRDLLSKKQEASSQGFEHEIVIHVPSNPENGENNAGGDVKVDLHHPNHITNRHPKAKKWEEMLPHEKEGWKRRLEDAGHWVADEGESVLKGVFFSGVAQGVGAFVAGG